MHINCPHSPLTDAQPLQGVHPPQLCAERPAGRHLLLPRLAEHGAQGGLGGLRLQQALQQLLLPPLLLLPLLQGLLGCAAAVGADGARPYLQLLQAQLRSL